MGKWLGVIRRGAYQEASIDSTRAYETISDWSYVDPNGYSSDDGSE